MTAFPPMTIPTYSHPLCPVGNHFGTLNLVSWEPPFTNSRYYDEKNPKDILRLGFEITDIHSPAGEPYLVHRPFTALLTPNSGLLAAIEQALNVRLTPEQARNFDFNSLLGQPFQVFIQHQLKEAVTYANIAWIQPAGPGQAATHHTPLISFNYLQPDPQMQALKEQYWPQLTRKGSTVSAVGLPPPHHPLVMHPATLATPVTPAPNPVPVAQTQVQTANPLPVAPNADPNNPFATPPAAAVAPVMVASLTAPVPVNPAAVPVMSPRSDNPFEAAFVDPTPPGVAPAVTPVPVLAPVEAAEGITFENPFSYDWYK